jgi:hypothetical protein
MNDVEEYIGGFEGDDHRIMVYLHRMMMDQPGIHCRIAFKIPVYYRNSWICYINPLKKGGIEFVFTRGRELSNEQGILMARGRKEVRGIIFHTAEDIPWDKLHEVVQEAILLDETVPYSSPYFKR